MKRLTFFLTGFIGLALTAAHASDAPRGSFLELHSCEVYAGPCVISSESTMQEHYMLQAWDFTGGSFRGANFSGLQVAVLQASAANLAASGSKSANAVVYLPQAATPAQRDALLAWLKSSQPELRPATLQTRVAPLSFAKSATGYAFAAGKYVSVKTAPFATCPVGSCGEELGYQPRSATSLFTVVVDRDSRVVEPLLELKWTDFGRRTIFLGRFGQPDFAKTEYVSMSDLCGASQALF